MCVSTTRTRLVRFNPFLRETRVRTPAPANWAPTSSAPVVSSAMASTCIPEVGYSIPWIERTRFSSVQSWAPMCFCTTLPVESIT